MVLQSSITAMLLGVFFCLVIPVIAIIALMIMKKVKVGAFFLGILWALVATLVGSLPAAMTSLQNNVYVANVKVTIMSNIFVVVLSVAAIALSLIFLMKNSQNVQGGTSFGLGFGFVTCSGVGFALSSFYFIAMMLNTGQFNTIVDQMGDAGVSMTGDENPMMVYKRMVETLTASDAVLMTLSGLVALVIYVAIALIIVQGIIKNKPWEAAAIALGVHLLYSVSGIIEATKMTDGEDILANATATVTAANVLPSVLVAVAALAAIIVITKKNPPPVVTPVKKADPFMQSVEGAKKDEFNAET